MIGYEIKETGNAGSVTVFDNEAVYNWVMKITEDKLEAIEASSWSELVTVGEVYIHDDFTIEVVDTEE